MSRTISFTRAEVAAYYASRVPHLKQRGEEWRGRCPIHSGIRESFAVSADTGAAFCHSECGRGWDLIGLEMEMSGAGFGEARAEVLQIIGRSSEQKERPFSERIETAYSYTDERGELLYQVVRLHSPKDFRQRRPDGLGGWVWRKHPQQVLYRLPEVLEAPIVFLVEGERDVETLREYGFVATTNAGGAKAPWLDSYTEALRGHEVIAIPDNDAPGRARVLRIARALSGNVGKLVILTLDNPGVKDITDWFGQGRSELELIGMLDEEGVAQ